MTSACKQDAYLASQSRSLGGEIEVVGVVAAYGGSHVITRPNVVGVIVGFVVEIVWLHARSD